MLWIWIIRTLEAIHYLCLAWWTLFSFFWRVNKEPRRRSPNFETHAGLGWIRRSQICSTNLRRAKAMNIARNISYHLINTTSLASKELNILCLHCETIVNYHKKEFVTFFDRSVFTNLFFTPSTHVWLSLSVSFEPSGQTVMRSTFHQKLPYNFEILVSKNLYLCFPTNLIFTD